MLMNLLSFNENELKINFSSPELLKISINDNLLYQFFFKIAQIQTVEFYFMSCFCFSSPLEWIWVQKSHFE